MQILRDIAYRPQSEGVFGLGDLYLPRADAAPAGAVLCIHGGAWFALDRQSFAGVAEFFCRDLGMAAFNVEYRYCTDAPWPACGDDCLTAAAFLVEVLLPKYLPGIPPVFVAGASAGGHLALMTGLRLPPESVAGIVSISGIAALEPDMKLDPRRYWRLFGGNPTPEQIRDASPARLAGANSAPILLTHAIYDQVVPVESATDFEDAARAAGGRVESYYYNRRNDGHCIWIPGSSPHRLHPDLEERVRAFCAKCGAAAPRMVRK